MINTPFARIPFDHEVFSLDVAELSKFVKELAIIFDATVFGQIGYRMRRVQYREPVSTLKEGCRCRSWVNNGSRVSFDDLIGGRQQCRRKLQSERFRRCAIEHQFELGWLVERNVTRLRAL